MSSEQTGKLEPVSLEILHTGGRYPELVEEHLRSQGGEVTSCQLSATAPQAVDRPEECLPPGLGQADLVIAIALPSGLLAALPGVLSQAGGKALLVPIEDPEWVQPGLARQLQQLCQEAGLEFAAPMPFCALTPTGEVISRFCEQYQVGQPRLQFTVGDGVVTGCCCVRGAPCGLTPWVAEQLTGMPTDRVVDRAQTLHHARPCLASMVLLRGTGDTIMHLSVDMFKRVVANALRRAQGGSVISQRP
jgi:hypothetical protein